jgi:hypothetical protein
LGIANSIPTAFCAGDARAMEYFSRECDMETSAVNPGSIGIFRPPLSHGLTKRLFAIPQDEPAPASPTYLSVPLANAHLFLGVLIANASAATNDHERYLLPNLRHDATGLR